MKIFPIDDGVSGEQILAVQPQIERYPDTDWRMRLEYFTGRALTHTALRLEQRGRSYHLATLGNSFSPGVISGLEAVASVQSSGVLLEIAAGMGLTKSGETVSLNRNHQLLLDDTRVCAPASLLSGQAGATSAEGGYAIGGTLGELRSQAIDLPSAMILVLQPVSVEYFSESDSSDPCDFDPTDEAYENWQWVDGFRLLLYTWPVAMGVLPGQGDWRRNRIANAVFEAERFLREGETQSWHDFGVPIGLAGFNETLDFVFLDNNAVVRRGGEPPGGGVPIVPLGNRFMWQARFEQFQEHLTDWVSQDSSLDLTQIQAGTEFRYLPPVGVLPKQCISPRQHVQHFFPMSYGVRALVIPYEQLDLAIEESINLLSFDLNTPDRVEVLVPVMQEHYDPQLLVIESIDPLFDQTISRYSVLRDQWLGRRLVVRNRASAVYEAMTGSALAYPLDDMGAVDALENPVRFELPLVKAGDGCSYFKGTTLPPKNWIQGGFDDSGWDVGATAIGYGRDLLATNLDDMKGKYVTIFLRHIFSLDGVSEQHRYTIVVTTNGGFTAWLNGRKLTSANVSSTDLTATADGEQSLEPRRYELGELVGRLEDGTNLFAIQAHNSSIDQAAFSIRVELLDTEGDYGTTVISSGLQKIPFGREQYSVKVIEELTSYLDASTPLTEKEIAKLKELGIEKFIAFLKRKINRTDDKVEFGFLRVRTDIYRLRQMMLGNEAGTKLATSPVLAEIAKGESAVATKDELSSFYDRLKTPPKSGDDLPPVGASRASGITGASTVRMESNVFLAGELADASTRIDKQGEKSNFPTIEADISTIKYARVEESSGLLFQTDAASIQDVGLQNPVIGKVQSFNNVTVGERLVEASANVAYQAGLAVNGELITEFMGPEISSSDFVDNFINVDDLPVPGVAEQDGDELKNLKFSDVRGSDEVQQKIRNGTYYPVGTDDEAGHFNAGVLALENVIGTLRLIEGRVYDYRLAVERCGKTLTSLKNELARADLRLKTISTELAEARHDVSVARSLKAEEQARIAALNSHRDKVLENDVPFLIFRRPRTADPRLDTPIHFLNPDFSEQPLPICDLSEVEVPEAIAAMIDVVRDAPLKWFTAVNVVMPQLSRPADLHITLAGAKKRAMSKVTVHPYLKMDFAGTDKLLLGLGSVLKVSQQRIQTERSKVAAIDMAAFQRLGWQESMTRVPEVVSLGDVIDGNHGRMTASRRAADELEMFSKVASCLYLGFSDVSATIRLLWAEQFSQHDSPVNLRNLHSLPRFNEIEYSERYTLQRLVDWLYGRIVTEYGEAEELVGDLVRVALLSASHAPANELISGYLPEPASVWPGSRVNVTVNLSRVRVGMAVSMVSEGASLARGRVADISGGQVTAEVLTLVGTSVTLAAGTRVQIGERLGMA